MAAPSDTTGSGPVPASEVIEVDGLLWKPKSGATSSGEQFSRARSLLLKDRCCLLVLLHAVLFLEPVGGRGPHAGVPAGNSGL
jgi:hypothetical protein